MSTKDKILNPEPPKVKKVAPLVTDKPVAIPEPPKIQKLAPLVTEKPKAIPAPPTDPQVPIAQQEEQPLTYTDMFKSLNTYKPPTEEELEAERKKHKRDQMFAAIGDGISSLSNLYFASKGAPSMYDGKNSQSEKTRVTYEKLMNQRNKEAHAYQQGLMNAQMADDAKANTDKNWRYQLEAQKKADERYDADKKHQADREKIADDRYDAGQETAKTQAAEEKDRWERKFKQDQANSNARLALEREKEANLEIHRGSSSSSKKDKVGFKSADGNQISIDKDVLDGSMAEVYNQIMKDPKAKDLPTYDMPRTSNDIEDFVKKYWSRSPNAVKFMKELSGYSTSDESRVNEGGSSQNTFVPTLSSASEMKSPSSKPQKYKLGMFSQK